MTGVPPGGSRRQWWQRYHRPNSLRPFSSPRRRRGSQAVAAASSQVAQPWEPREPRFNCNLAKRNPTGRRRSGPPRRIRGPATLEADELGSLPPSSAALLRGPAQRPASSSPRCRGWAPASAFVSHDGEQQRLQGRVHCRREI